MSSASTEGHGQPPIPGPPYPPQVAGVGGIPSLLPDAPTCAVFIALYLTFFASNIGLFRNNLSKGHFFLPSGLMGGFSMARVLTCSLRIGWATNQTDISLAIAAMIFVNAGILIIYIINILFAQRILRAMQPQLGWKPAVKIFFVAVYILTGVSLVLVIVLTVMSFYTLDQMILSEARWIQRGASTYLLVVTILPLILLALAFGMPRSQHTQPFGEGSMASKAILLAISSCLCITIAGFREGTGFDPRPVTNPAWYHSKAAFYVFNFTLEILILTLYTGMRVDKRFFVPKGSHKRRSYIEEDRVKSEDSRDTEGEMEKERHPSLEGAAP